MTAEKAKAAQKAAHARDWTQGSIVRNFFSLSWPTIVSESAFLTTIIDMVWIGKIGASAIAGVGVALMIAFLVLTAQMGLTAGSRALVARFIGAGDVEKANHVIRQAVFIGVVYGTGMAAVAIAFPGQILGMLGLEAESLSQGVLYLRTHALGWLPTTIWLNLYYIMQSSGDTRSPMRTAVFARSVHMFLCPFLIFGWWLFPRMGVAGAAASNAFAEVVALSIGFWIMSTGRTRLHLTMKGFRVDPATIWRIMKISIPAGVMVAQRSLGNIALMWFVIPFGTLAVAAHALTLRVDTVLTVPTFGLSQGAGVLVGQNLGAGKPERAERSGWLGAAFVQAFMIVCSVVLLLWAEGIIGIFSSNPELITVGAAFLRIATAGYIVLGLGNVLMQCIAAAGDTMVPMVVGLISMWGVQVPLAFILPDVAGLGVNGVRWAIVAGAVVSSIVYTVYFRLGRWKHKKI